MGTIVVSIILISAVTSVIISLVKKHKENKKNGGCGCGCSCGCSGCSHKDHQ